MNRYQYSCAVLICCILSAALASPAWHDHCRSEEKDAWNTSSEGVSESNGEMAVVLNCNRQDEGLCDDAGNLTFPY